MKKKISDILGYVLFIVLLSVASPFLFLSGGIARILRFYLYVSNNVHNKDTKNYKF